MDDTNLHETSSTHPRIDERIQKIITRNAMQPEQLNMDLDFNNTVLRIMRTVQNFLAEFLENGGEDFIKKFKFSLSHS